MVRSGAPFIEYDIAGLNEFLSGSVDEMEHATLLGETEEGTGHRVGGEFTSGMLRHMDVGHATENMESRDIQFCTCVLFSRCCAKGF